MTVEEHCRRYELICKSVCDQPMVSGVLDEDRPDPYLTDDEWDELEQLEDAVQADIDLLDLS